MHKTVIIMNIQEILPASLFIHTNFNQNDGNFLVFLFFTQSQFALYVLYSYDTVFRSKLSNSFET